MKASIIFVGTSKYKDYFSSYYERNQKLFLPDAEKTFYAFSDRPNDKVFLRPNVVVHNVEHEKWPLVSLKRFEYMKLIIDDLEKYDWVFFVDADLHAQNATHTYEIDGDHDYIGVEHPGFHGRPNSGTFERDSLSSASVRSDENPPYYWQGCFWGVRGSKVRTMIDTLVERVNSDLKREYIAVWFDESHINRFFIDYCSRTKTLHPGFAAPDPELGYVDIHRNFEAKFHHLLKDNVVLHGGL